MKNLKYILILLTVVWFYGCETSGSSADEDATGPAKLSLIETPATTGSGELNLFTDPGGNVYLSWVENTEKESVLKFSTFENEAWSEPRTITSGSNWFVNWADFPMVASDGKGNLAAHYLAKTAEDTYAYGVFMVFSRDGGKTWSEPVIPHETETPTEHGFMSILPWEDGYFAAWLDGRNTGEKGGDMTIRAAFMDFSGNIREEFELDNRICDCCQTSVVLTDHGPVVLYRDRSEKEIRDMSIVRWEEGNWTAPEIIYHDNWYIPGCPVNGPVAVSDGSNLAVAWYTAPDEENRINFSYSRDAGKSFSKPVRIDDGHPIGRVDIEMLDDGSAIVSWVEDTGVTGEIRVKHLDAEGNELDAFVLAKTSVSRASGFPQMTRQGNKLIFAWRDVRDEDNPVIKTAVYRL